MFFAFEGIDASGKATQSKLLAEKIGAALFSFPDYSTPVGQLIKSNLKQEWKATCEGFTCGANPPGNSWVDHTPEQYLNAMLYQSLQLANRLERASDLHSSVAKGHVVADRYTASAIVYGGADGLDREYLEKAQSYLPQPDYQILLDIDPDASVARRPARRDRLETQVGLMAEVAKRYRQYWWDKAEESLRQLPPPSTYPDFTVNADPTRWIIIDGNRSVEDVHKEILEVVLL